MLDKSRRRSGAHRERGRILRDRGDHTVWACPCGQHIAQVLRHKRSLQA